MKPTSCGGVIGKIYEMICIYFARLIVKYRMHMLGSLSMAFYLHTIVP